MRTLWLETAAPPSSTDLRGEAYAQPPRQLLCYRTRPHSAILCSPPRADAGAATWRPLQVSPCLVRPPRRLSHARRQRPTTRAAVRRAPSAVAPVPPSCCRARPRHAGTPWGCWPAWHPLPVSHALLWWRPEACQRTPLRESPGYRTGAKLPLYLAGEVLLCTYGRSTLCASLGEAPLRLTWRSLWP